jgi:hypothetical protein
MPVPSPVLARNRKRRGGQGLTAPHRLADDTGTLALDIDDKPDAAGFMFELRIVQALLGRRAGSHWRAGFLFVFSLRHFCGDLADTVVTVKFA